MQYYVALSSCPRSAHERCLDLAESGIDMWAPLTSRRAELDDEKGRGGPKHADGYDGYME